MDTLMRYRHIVQQVMTNYAAHRPSLPTIEVETILDPQTDHYQIMTMGWRDQERIYGTILHVDIRRGKIWIQHDGTEDGIAEQFVAAGIPKTDIVLAYQSPFKRQFSEFAVE